MFENVLSWYEINICDKRKIIPYGFNGDKLADVDTMHICKDFLAGGIYVIKRGKTDVLQNSQTWHV